MLLNIVGSSIKATKGGFIMENTNKREKQIKKQINKNFMDAAFNIMLLTVVNVFALSIMDNLYDSVIGMPLHMLLLLVCTMDIIADIIISVIKMIKYSKIRKESVEL